MLAISESQSEYTYKSKINPWVIGNIKTRLSSVFAFELK